MSPGSGRAGQLLPPQRRAAKGDTFRVVDTPRGAWARWLTFRPPVARFDAILSGQLSDKLWGVICYTGWFEAFTHIIRRNR